MDYLSAEKMEDQGLDPKQFGMGFLGCGSESICTDPRHHGVKIQFQVKNRGDDKFFVLTDKCMKCIGNGCNKRFLRYLPNGADGPGNQCLEWGRVRRRNGNIV